MQQSNRRKKILIKNWPHFLFAVCLAFHLSRKATISTKFKNKLNNKNRRSPSKKRAQAKLQASLKEQESKINSVVGELRETELSLKEIRKQMAETEKQIKQLEKQERVQKAKLAKQIDAIYRSGVNPSTLERMLSEDAKKKQNAWKCINQHLNQVRIDMN